MRDPYAVLGVSRGASADEIKQAFRRLAKEHHPDRNPGDATAQERFSELNTAYQILGDPARRARFDQLGADRAPPGAGAGAAMPDDLEAWLAEILSGGLGGGGFGRSGPQTSGHLREVLELSFEEAALGCKKRLSYERADVCDACDGQGASPNTRVSECGTCGGQGRVRLGALGWISLGLDRVCPACKGTGKVPEVPCAACSGRGVRLRPRTLEVTIPQGVEDGAAQVIAGAGSRGAARQAPGDLELVLRIKPHERWRREGDDIIDEVSVSFAKAALGGSVPVQTLHGEEELRVPPGTQAGSLLDLRHKGVPHRFRPGAGHHRCRVVIRVPKQVSARAQELLEQFDREQGEEEASMLDKLKSLFT